MLTGKIDTRELETALKNLANNMSPQKTGSALKAGGTPIMARAKQLVHVISGDLRNSLKVSDWFKDGDGVSVIVGTNVEYAAMEEFGGQSGVDRFGRPLPPHLAVRSPHPYLRPAYEQTWRTALEIIKTKLARNVTA